MMTYELALEMVDRALQDGETFNLAIAFTETTYRPVIKEIIAEQYHEAANSVKDFDLTVEEYIFETMDDSKNMKEPYAFCTAEDAEEHGYFWMDAIGRWIKLAF